MTVIDAFPRIVYGTCYFMVYDGIQHFADYNELIRFYGDLIVKNREIHRKTGMIYITV